MTALIQLHAVMCIIGLTTALDVRGNARVFSKNVGYTGGNIGSGVGYSRDSEQLTAQRCYNTTTPFFSGQQSYVQLSQAISSIELENKLGISVSLSGSYGEFSADAKANYVRSIQDNEHSISLNYYEYATNKVTVQIAGPGDEALTESGKHFYQDGKNRYFGLVCGENFIKSYQQGALLTMGLYMNFRTSDDKSVFAQEAGASFGSIVSAAEKVKSVSAQHKLTGLVSIQAFQMGGEPSKLSEILNKDSAGNYYALTCSLAAMENCEKTASGLLDYATNNFPKQFSFEKNIGLTPLGVAFSEYQTIKWLELVIPTSLVTRDIVKYRKELSNKLKETRYYQQNLYPMLNGVYPTAIDEVMFMIARAIMSKLNKNMHILMQPHRGAADCFYFPEQCKNIKARIFSELEDLTCGELTVFNNIKYRILMPHGIWYNSGKDAEKSWIFNPYDKKRSYTVKSVQVTNTVFSYTLGTNSKNNNNSTETFFGKVHSDVMGYKGQMYVDDKLHSNVVATKQISPFFFKPYSELNGAIKMKIKLRLAVNNQPSTYTCKGEVL